MDSRDEADELTRRHTKPFIEHLEDLRRTVLWCALYIAVGVAAAIPLGPRILAWMKWPLARTGKDPETFLRVLRVASGFSIGTRVVFWSGVLISMPFVLHAIAGFVFPGLTPRERKGVARVSAAAALLFALGVWIGYVWTLPAALSMMFGLNRWLGISCEFVELADYVSFVLKLLLAFGLAFEMPVLLVALGAMGLVRSSQLRAKRAFVIVSIFIVAAVLTPPDVFSQLLMAIPLVVLYELCVWLIWLRERRR
jgi:sec-independent protein translocase protein TatC